MATLGGGLLAAPHGAQAQPAGKRWRIGILHVQGVLAYIALPAVPTEVIVRSPSGKAVFTERLGREAREEKEFCEGEAEGPA